MPISNSLLPYTPADTYGYAFLVGILNTLYVSFLGIVFATILGVFVGVARVSSNWLVSDKGRPICCEMWPGNKGFRRYLKMTKEIAFIDTDKVEYESRFDGKWVLTTNTDLSAQEVALKYKELWQVERLFRDVKPLTETRPVYHQCDENIRGHVFCSFLALVLRKELERRLNNAGHEFEWSDIKQDLKALQWVTVEDKGKRFAIRTQCQGTCGKIFQVVKVALPPTIREMT